MGLLAETITTTGRRARMFAEKLLADIPAAQFACRPGVDGQLVNCNHPAWIYGHLSLYPAKVLQFLSQDASAVTPPDTWPELFNPGTTCQHDPVGTIYPDRDTLTSTCLRAYDVVLDQVAECDDEQFAAPTPDERYRTFLPTIGTAALSMLNNHVVLHLGQLSTWRRCFGLGSIM